MPLNISRSKFGILVLQNQLKLFLQLFFIHNQLKLFIYVFYDLYNHCMWII